MTDIEWGAEIAVDGVRPGWLRDEDRVSAWNAIRRRIGLGDGPDGYCWDEVRGIVLPANHPYYLATSRGFTYWPGGESAPEDWDGGEVLCANGNTWDGKVNWTPGLYSSPIGYRKRTEHPAPAIAPELVERMVAFIRACRDENRSKITEAREARDILAELEPDPDLTLAKSIVGDADAIALAIKAARENGRG